MSRGPGTSIASCRSTTSTSKRPPILREHLRIPGMGETTARYFRDKLAMRVKAQNAGILVPRFIHVLNDERIARVSSRDAGALGAQAAIVGRRDRHQADRHRDDLWPTLDDARRRRSFFLLEQFVPGDVYHVDSIVWDRDGRASRRRTATASRRWRSRTTAACSSRAPCRRRSTKAAARWR